jgi:hypothetical protein
MYYVRSRMWRKLDYVKIQQAKYSTGETIPIYGITITIIIIINVPPIQLVFLMFPDNWRRHGFQYRAASLYHHWCHQGLQSVNVDVAYDLYNRSRASIVTIQLTMLHITAVNWSRMNFLPHSIISHMRLFVVQNAWVNCTSQSLISNLRQKFILKVLYICIFTCILYDQLLSKGRFTKWCKALHCINLWNAKKNIFLQRDTRMQRKGTQG